MNQKLKELDELYQQAIIAKTKADLMIEQVKSELTAILGDQPQLKLPSGRVVTWVTRETKRYDSLALHDVIKDEDAFMSCFKIDNVLVRQQLKTLEIDPEDRESLEQTMIVESTSKYILIK